MTLYSFYTGYDKNFGKCFGIQWVAVEMNEGKKDLVCGLLSKQKETPALDG